MGQVPEKEENRPYLIVGNGRLARHFATYFTLNNIPHYHWYRRSELRLRPLLKETEKALVFISDGAIVPFILEHQTNYVTWIHCSGPSGYTNWEPLSSSCCPSGCSSRSDLLSAPSPSP